MGFFPGGIRVHPDPGLGILLAAYMKQLLRCTMILAATVLAAGLFAHTSARAQDMATNLITGTVLQTTNAGGYTYVEVDTGKQKVWAAGPESNVNKGDKVAFESGMIMTKFESKSLHRTFDTIHFVSGISTPASRTSAKPAGTTQAMPNDSVHSGLQPGMHPSVGAGANSAGEIKNIKKAEGGYTVAELHANKAKLENKPVTFRGKVVKFNSQIMKKNWAHVQDGSGKDATADITVTSADTVKVGDTVLVKGTLVLNKDFGFGYKYDLLVENATLTVENAK